MPEWLSLIPPLVAITLAIWTRQVILALLVGIGLSETIFHSLNPAYGALAAIERVAMVLNDPGDGRILLFCILIGALLALIRHSGGVEAFVARLSHSRLTGGPRQVGLLTALVGSSIFIETNMSVLTTGTLSRSLFDRFGLSRERLAYILDSTCAPVSVLILTNAWGAYVLSLIDQEVSNPIAVLTGSVALNFYAILTLVGVYYTVLSNRVHGPLRQFEARTKEVTEAISASGGKVRDMVVPLVVLIGGMLGFMWYTGEGEILRGSGSKSVLWAVCSAIAVAYLMQLGKRGNNLEQLNQVAFRGMGELLPLVVILLLSMALGDSLSALGSGDYLASLLSGQLPPLLLAPLLFLLAAGISFSTGTSWGTFAIMIPIGLPLSLSMDVSPALALSAILGGGVFGDHCSPISDTTVISSLAAGCDHMDHVRTQLPYALTTGGLTILLYLLVGSWL